MNKERKPGKEIQDSKIFRENSGVPEGRTFEEGGTRYDDTTKAHPVAGETAVDTTETTEPTDGEQALENEIIDAKVYEKALGATALESLSEEDIAVIENSPSLSATLKYLASESELIASNESLQKGVADWLKFAVRGEKLPDDSAYNKISSSEDDDEEEADDEEAASGIGANAIAIKTRAQIGIQELNAKNRSKRQIRIATKRAAAEEKYADDKEQLEKEYKKIDRRENIKTKLKIGGVAIVSVGTILGGYYFFTRHGLHSASGSPTPTPNPDHLPQSEVPAPKAPELIPGTQIPLPTNPEQMRQFFETAIDPANRPDKLGIHDFNHPIPNGNDPTAFKLALGDQLRGNSHELARYLSKANIPGAPLEKDFSSQSAYLDALNTYGDNLDKDPTLHFQQYSQLVEKFQNPNTTFTVRDINNAYSSDFIQNGRVGIDDYVPKNGTVTIVDFHDGTEPILVRNECGQTIRELIEQHIERTRTVVPVREVVTEQQPVRQNVLSQPVTPVRNTPTGGGSQGGGGGSHGGGSGGGGTTPETPLEEKHEVFNPYNNTTDEATHRGGELATVDPVKDLQNRQNVSRPSSIATPGGGMQTGGNNGETAGGASPERGSFGQAGEAQAGSNPTSAGSSAGSESGAGSTGGSDSGSGSGAQSSRASE